MLWWSVVRQGDGDCLELCCMYTGIYTYLETSNLPELVRLGASALIEFTAINFVR